MPPSGAPSAVAALVAAVACRSSSPTSPPATSSTDWPVRQLDAGSATARSGSIDPRPHQEPRRPSQGPGPDVHHQRGILTPLRVGVLDTYLEEKWRQTRTRLRPPHTLDPRRRPRAGGGPQDVPGVRRGLPNRGPPDRGADPTGVRRPRPRDRGAWTETPGRHGEAGRSSYSSATSALNPTQESSRRPPAQLRRRLPPGRPPGRPGLAGHPRQLVNDIVPQDAAGSRLPAPSRSTSAATAASRTR